MKATKKQLANLKPYKKGESGNPQGKKPGTLSLKKRLREALLKIGEGNAESYDVLLIKKMLKKAIVDGDNHMIKLMWEYMEGMPKQAIEMSGPEGGEIEISIANKQIFKIVAETEAKIQKQIEDEIKGVSKTKPKKK